MVWDKSETLAIQAPSDLMEILDPTETLASKVIKVSTVTPAALDLMEIRARKETKVPAHQDRDLREIQALVTLDPMATAAPQASRVVRVSREVAARKEIKEMRERKEMWDVWDSLALLEVMVTPALLVPEARLETRETKDNQASAVRAQRE